MERNDEIMRDRESGMTLSQLAKKYGLTRERIRQICNKVAERRELENDELWQRLEAASSRVGGRRVVRRAYNVVRRGFRVSKDEVVPFYEIPREDWGKLRNCGRKTVELLYEAFPDAETH